MSIADYFDMGGYAAFIWPSYALAVLSLVGLFMLATRRLKAIERGDAGADGSDEGRP